jgi:hypothetical protein
MQRKCIAFTEKDVTVEASRKRHTVYVPCGKRTSNKRDFCYEHDRAYRELLLGIIVNGQQASKRNRA